MDTDSLTAGLRIGEFTFREWIAANGTPAADTSYDDRRLSEWVAFIVMNIMKDAKGSCSRSAR